MLEEEELELLEDYSDEELGKLWNRARNILQQRNRANLVNGNIYAYTGPIISCVRLDIITRAQLAEAKRDKIPLSFDPLVTIECSGGCNVCPFGMEDLHDEWHCTLPPKKVTIIEKPPPKPKGKPGRKKKE